MDKNIYETKGGMLYAVVKLAGIHHAPSKQEIGEWARERWQVMSYDYPPNFQGQIGKREFYRVLEFWFWDDRKGGLSIPQQVKEFCSAFGLQFVAYC